MKNKKSIYIVILVIGHIFLLVYFLGFLNKNKQAVFVEEPQVITKTLSEITPTIKPEIKIPPKIQTQPKISTDEIVKDIQVTLNVLDKKYQVDTKENSTVFEVMEKIEKENLFNFKYKEHIGLGIFITEINGIKSGSGKYWIYYVNGKEASVGVSKNVLKDGDIISWKQE